MFDHALAALDVDQFWRDGYAVVPDAYSADEVEQMRAEAREQVARGGELATGPLRHVLSDGRMVKVAQKLLGTDAILYGGDSSATINGKIRAWHKDNTDREDPEAPDWDDRYTQLRFGIYLQDHTAHTGGLNLKVGSHEHCDLTTGETIYVRNRPGDLLVWSMAMTHSGDGTLLLDPTAPDPEPSQHDSFAPEEVAPSHDERMAVFVHLGADDKHGKRYLDYLKTRTYIVSGWRRHPFTDEVLADLASGGLTVRDMPAEVKDDKRAGLEASWQPFWYPGMKPPAAPATKAPAPKAPAKKAPAKKAPAKKAPAKKAAAKKAPLPPAAPEAFAVRYGKAVKRRLKGVATGARQGWHDASAKPRPRPKAGTQARPRPAAEERSPADMM